MGGLPWTRVTGIPPSITSQTMFSNRLLLLPSLGFISHIFLATTHHPPRHLHQPGHRSSVLNCSNKWRRSSILLSRCRSRTRDTTASSCCTTSSRRAYSQHYHHSLKA